METQNRAFIGLLNAASAQPVVVKTNLLYGTYTYTPNISLEIGLGCRSTFELGGGYNWLTYGDSQVAIKKLRQMKWHILTPLPPLFRATILSRQSDTLINLRARVQIPEYNNAMGVLEILQGNYDKTDCYLQGLLTLALKMHVATSDTGPVQTNS